MDQTQRTEGKPFQPSLGREHYQNRSDRIPYRNLLAIDIFRQPGGERRQELRNDNNRCSCFYRSKDVEHGKIEMKGRMVCNPVVFPYLEKISRHVNKSQGIQMRYDDAFRRPG